VKVVYPGSFDPITYGHLDIIKRCSMKFEEVVVAVLENASKRNLFSLEERCRLIQEAVEPLENVRVESFSGLLVDYVSLNKFDCVIRGLRSVSDFEYEFQMALVNHQMDALIETFFMVTSSRYSYLSSSIVKEVASFHGDVGLMVPTHVASALNEKFAEGE
jgi:pantetheine-phosphate adenylyltransferase